MTFLYIHVYQYNSQSNTVLVTYKAFKLLSPDYVEEIYQTFLKASKDREAIQKARKSMSVENVPPTSGNASFTKIIS